MRSLAAAAMRSPWTARLYAAGFALMASVFPPFLLVSGAIGALATLRHGAVSGLLVLAPAAVLSIWVKLTQTVSLGPALTLPIYWAGVWCSAIVLRRTADQGRAMSVNACAVACYAVAMRIRHPDVGAYWRSQLDAVNAHLKAQGGALFDDQQLAVFAGVMHESALVMVMALLAGTLLTARWWQAALYNPGGFRGEFHALRLPRAVSTVAAIVALAALLQMAQGSYAGLANDGVLLLVLLFACQGLAVTHARAHALGWRAAWLGVLYVLLALVTLLTGAVLAIVGIADMLVDFRKLGPPRGRQPGHE